MISQIDAKRFRIIPRLKGRYLEQCSALQPPTWYYIAPRLHHRRLSFVRFGIACHWRASLMAATWMKVVLGRVGASPLAVFLVLIDGRRSPMHQRWKGEEGYQVGYMRSCRNGRGPRAHATTGRLCLRNIGELRKNQKSSASSQKSPLSTAATDYTVGEEWIDLVAELSEGRGNERRWRIDR